MFRVTLIELALAATPFLLYFAIRALVSSRRRVVGEDLNDAPYQFLLVIGASLAVGALVWQVLNRHEPDNVGKIYVPPRVVEGELVPGHFIDAPPDDGERFRFEPDADPLRPPEPPRTAPRSTRTADELRGETAEDAVDEVDNDADEAEEDPSP